jgi:hypothetical protein
MSADIAFAMAAIYFFEENCSLLMSWVIRPRGGLGSGLGPTSSFIQ